jgi:flagellum-specific peptidoglycan hydrolase FlgJ
MVGMTKTEFVKKILVACATAKNHGAKFNTAVVCAQAALESGWGNSRLTVKANNLFGIKAGSKWTGPTLDLPTKEWSKQRGWYKTVARWCSWSRWTDCIIYYAGMLQRLSWFRDALDHTGDADKFLEALLPADSQPGWATDPRYASKVRAIGARIERLGGPKWG